MKSWSKLRFGLMVVVALAILWAVALLGATKKPVPSATTVPSRSSQLEIHLLDVKHGDVQLIRSPTGETLLIDAGRAEFAQKTADYLRQVLGVVAVDYFLATHYHVDHIGAVPTLLRDHGLVIRKALYDRGGERGELNESAYRAYLDAISDPTRGITRVRIRTGDSIDLGPRLSVRVLAVGDVDTHTATGVPVVGENDNSIVLWLTFGKFDYWTGGDLSGEASTRYADIESAVIPWLPREADAFKANHHCVNYNNNPEFLAALKPTVSLVSTSHEVVGWKCILRLEAQSEVYLTDQIPAHKAAGDIVLISRDGNTFDVAGKTYLSK
jgi:competence protein ComEC